MAVSWTSKEAEAIALGYDAERQNEEDRSMFLLLFIHQQSI